MDINKLTQKSREAVQDAQALTIEYGNTQIEQAHLLYALLAQENGLIPQMLTKMEIDPEAVKADAQQAVSRLPKVSGPGREPDKVYISQDVDRALNAAQNQADHMTDEYISVEHLMLGLMETADSNLKTIFQRHNLTKEKFLEALKTVPQSYREGAFALGAGKWRVIRTVVLPTCINGIITGCILSIGRILSESAALLFTAGFAHNLNGFFEGLGSSGATLTVALYVYAKEQGEFEVAYAIAAILMILTILINIATTFMGHLMERRNGQ